MELNKLSSAILNDLWGGNVIPLDNRSLISQEQIEDEIVEVRSSIIREWYYKNLLNRHDLMMAINCVPVDCKDQNKCNCINIHNAKNAKHFEIPILLDGIGDDAIEFVGSTDRSLSYTLYYNKEAANYQQYKKRGADKPYVYIERTPNENNRYDCWIFNAPFVQNIAVIGIFKDPRQLSDFMCSNRDSDVSCDINTDYTELGSISDEIKRRILDRKVRLYRTPVPPVSQTV